MNDYYVREDVLAATLEALAAMDSPLLCELRTAISEQETIAANPRLGQSFYGSVKVNLESSAVGRLIVDLQRIEGVVGWNAQFGGRQINLIIVAWRQFRKTIDEPPSLPI